ncbi:MAG: DUF5110 domain-containing protein [Lentimicrobiaceae bacterium]|nr:DUF5110 domain-containing protein [Lentimicrobiaceae bacterium]
MKKTNLLFFLMLLFAAQNLYSQAYEKVESGVRMTASAVSTEIRFYSPEIVRIFKYPEGTTVNKNSLSVIKIPEKTDIKINQKGQVVTLSSSALTVGINLETGKITYTDTAGKLLFTEKDFGMQFTPTMDVKTPTYLARQAFVLDKNEAIYGLGQQQNNKLMQRSQRIILKNENMKVCIPYFLSVKGYGIFWDNYAATTFTDNQQETSFESLGNCADYYFMLGGSGKGVIAQMRALTGQSPMMALWTFGYFQSKERYKTQEELVGVVEKYRALQVPLDGIIQDWQYWGRDSVWNSMSFDPKTHPDPVGMVNKIHQMNAHVTIVAWPGFGPLTKQYAEFKEKKMLIDFDTWPPNSGAKPYDPYNPVARDIYWDYLNKGVFSKGFDAWWLDSSEPDHINIKDEDFEQPTYLGSYQSVINAFPLVHTSGVYTHQRATTSDKRVYLLTRSAFAGQQRNAANTWSGDVVSTWETLGKQIPAALNFSMTGIPYWNGDIGGFFAGHYVKDGGAKNPQFQELYVRWLQFATFTPMMRSHGTDIPREIYQFGDHGSWAFDAIEKGINLRYRLLPYLYSTAWQVTSQSASFLNALPLDFVSDKKVRNITDEYLFGSSILVAPVVNPMYTSETNDKVSADFSKTKSRKVYLPEGADWYDFWTGEKLKGGQKVEKEAPIDITPLYIKAGSILPWGPKVQYAAEKKWDDLVIRVYPGANGEFTLYEDETDNYNYEKGLYSTITFSWDDAKKELTVSDRKGEFPGVLNNRKFEVVIVKEKSGAGIETSLAPKTIKYSGKKTVIKLK